MTEAFFAYARERHSIYLRRQRGDPWPWSPLPVFQTSRFTNVFRELDRTTAWFRRNVREPLRDRPEVLLATVVFRWFNRTTTGEAIFCQGIWDVPTRWNIRPLIGNMPTAFDVFLHSGCDTSHLKHAIVTTIGRRGPYVTGAYTINTRSAGLGLSKLDGVLRLIGMWLDRHNGDTRTHWKDMAGQAGSMEQFSQWVQSPCLAGFMAYELACDLQWTPVLERAPDIDTWANVGPGAIRGLNRIHGRPVTKGMRQPAAVDECRELLELSRSTDHWPQMRNGLYMITGAATRYGLARMALQNFNAEAPAWPAWGLREVEHTLCEFDKFERVQAGQGKTRGRFTWPH